MSLESSRRELKTLLFEKGYRFETEEDWKVAEDLVMTWFSSLKVEESYDTFNKAFRESRMTIRGIKEDRQTGSYSEKVPIRGQEHLGGVRLVSTLQGVAGVKERMKDANFRGMGAENKEKYKKGLFDVSAVLLDGSRSLKIGGKGNQMYRLTGDTTYVFMPVASQDDMLVFAMLCVLAKYQKQGNYGLKIFAQYMKSRLTRIKLAFEGDAGCKFLDFAPSGELQPKFRYGFGKIMKGDASDEEVSKRKLDAALYKKVLLGNNRNEIVLAYRQHGTLAKPSSFPIYAKGVFDGETHKGFVVVDDTMRPTDEIITLAGEKQPGTVAGLGGVMTTPPVVQTL